MHIVAHNLTETDGARNSTRRRTRLKNLQPCQFVHTRATETAHYANMQAYRAMKLLYQPSLPGSFFFFFLGGGGAKKPAGPDQCRHSRKYDYTSVVVSYTDIQFNNIPTTRFFYVSRSVTEVIKTKPLKQKHNLVY